MSSMMPAGSGDSAEAQIVPALPAVAQPVAVRQPDRRRGGGLAGLREDPQRVRARARRACSSSCPTMLLISSPATWPTVSIASAACRSASSSRHDRAGGHVGRLERLAHRVADLHRGLRDRHRRRLRGPGTAALLPLIVPQGSCSAHRDLGGADQVAPSPAPRSAAWPTRFAPGLPYLVLVAVLAVRRGTHRLDRTDAAGRGAQSAFALQTVFAGVRFIRSKPAILGTISLDLFAVLLGGATALLPIYARDILQAGPWASASCAPRPRSAPC